MSTVFILIALLALLALVLALVAFVWLHHLHQQMEHELNRIQSEINRTAAAAGAVQQHLMVLLQRSRQVRVVVRPDEVVVSDWRADR